MTKLQDVKKCKTYVKMTDQTAGREITGRENARHEVAGPENTGRKTLDLYRPLKVGMDPP